MILYSFLYIPCNQAMILIAERGERTWEKGKREAINRWVQKHGDPQSRDSQRLLEEICGVKKSHK